MNVKVRCLCVSRNFRTKQAKQDHQKGFMSLQCRRNKDEYKDEYALFLMTCFFFCVCPDQLSCSAKQDKANDHAGIVLIFCLVSLLYSFPWSCV